MTKELQGAYTKNQAAVVAVVAVCAIMHTTVCLYTAYAATAMIATVLELSAAAAWLTKAGAACRYGVNASSVT